jgi:outer membrane lipoprotein-sorting protein
MYLLTHTRSYLLALLLLCLLCCQERRTAELESQLSEVQQQLEAAQSSRSVTQEALDTARSLFRRKMEAAAREVAELAQRVALAAG